MISQIAANSQTSMVELKTGLSLYTVELGNPVGAPMLVLHGGWGPADNEEHRLDILNEEIRSKFRIIYFINADGHVRKLKSYLEPIPPLGLTQTSTIVKC